MHLPPTRVAARVLPLIAALLPFAGCHTPIHTTPVALVAADQTPAGPFVTATAPPETNPAAAARPADWLALGREQHHRGLAPRQPAAARRAHHLAAAVYAWQALASAPTTTEHQAAGLLYRRALTLAFAASPTPGTALDLNATAFSWPDTGAGCAIVAGAMPASLQTAQRFLPADAFEPHGLFEHTVLPGLGVPLIAEFPPAPAGFTRTAAANLLARAEGTPADFAAGRGRLVLDLHIPADQEQLALFGRTEPLAYDLSSPAAYALNNERIWKLGRAHFLDSRQRVPTGLYLHQPHRPGRIPVVLVHGTLSSPLTWVQLINSLQADPLLRERFEFWLFVYNSGNPVSYSADLLRSALAAKRAELDPTGSDPALGQLVLVGHSQGGLLVKLQAVASGDALWRALSDRPYDPTHYPPAYRELIARSFFLEPAPGVRRVVFMATPHHGTRIARSFVSSLARPLLDLPGDLAQAALNFQQDSAVKLPPKLRRRIPSSLDGMSPTNPWLLALADLPVAPGIAAHSIIGIKDDTPPPGGTDGVVTYASAHLEPVESELVVRGKHGLPRNRAAIAELRRILHTHLTAADAPATHSAPSPHAAN